MDIDDIAEKRGCEVRQISADGFVILIPPNTFLRGYETEDEVRAYFDALEDELSAKANKNKKKND